MKKLFLSLAVIASIGCNGFAQKDKKATTTEQTSNNNDDNDNNGWGNGKKVKGNGNVTTQDRAVGSFSKLNLQAVCNVVLQQGATEAVKVETDENLQELVLTEVVDNTLTIKHPKKTNWSKVKKMVVYITYKDLSYINNSCVGNFSTKGDCNFKSLTFKNSAVGNTDVSINAEKVEIDNSAVGNTDLVGKATVCTLKNSAVGNVDAQDFIVEDMTIKNTAVGNLTYNAAKVQGKTSAVGSTKNKNKNGGNIKDKNEYND